MIDPVRKTVTVEAGVSAAFHRFTAELGAWWPLGTFSVSLSGEATAEMEGRVGGRILERHDGEEHMWGMVTAWEPPRRVAFTWHPGREASTAQAVEVTFESTGTGTRVTLVHTGWEALGEDAPGTRARYDTGWERVLGDYIRAGAQTSVASRDSR